MEKKLISSESIKYINFSNLPDRNFSQMFFLPKVFLWNGIYYSYEPLQGDGEIEVLLLMPQTVNDAAEMLADIFVSQNGGSELSFLKLILELHDWGVDNSAVFNMLESRFGKRFTKKIPVFTAILSNKRDLLELFISKNLSPKVLSETNNEIFSSLIKKIAEKTAVNSNTIENIVSWITETAVRENVSVEKIIEESRVLSLIDDEELSSADILRETKERFWKLRYPKWSEIRAELKSLSDSIRNETGITVTYPDFGEGNTLTIEYKIKKESDTKKLSEKIISAEKKISELLKKVQK